MQQFLKGLKRPRGFLKCLSLSKGELAQLPFVAALNVLEAMPSRAARWRSSAGASGQGELSAFSSHHFICSRITNFGRQARPLSWNHPALPSGDRALRKGRRSADGPVSVPK
jgi:hypothetical protein